MGKDLFRDSTIGQFINYVSAGRLLPYADQRPGYVIPSHLLPSSSRPVSVALTGTPKPLDGVKKEDAAVSNKRLSTFSVVGVDPRPPSRLSTGGRISPYADRRASMYGTDVQREDVPVSPVSNKRASFTVIGMDARPLSRLSTGGRLSPYADRRSSLYGTQFIIPGSETEIELTPVPEPSAMEDGSKRANASEESLPREVKRDSVALALVKEVEDGGQTSPNQIIALSDLNLVGWDGEDDPDNPRNWSLKKRVFVSSSISFLTFSVYIGSAIYTASIPGIMQEFNVSLVHATLGLTLYIIGYGVGPMFLAPLQEIPSIGRTPVFIYTLLIFVVLQAPIITAKNIETILVLRFFTGFFGGLAPATGGASMADMFPLQQLPYVMGIWSVFAILAPVCGPIVGSYAAQANGWRWPMWEMLWISGFALIFLVLSLPETYDATILLKRARRLRKLVGNDDLHTVAELQQEKQTAGEIMYEALVRPFVLMTEPVLAFTNVYLGFVYALFYLWFESFPLVFTDIYDFNFGNSSLPFVGYVVTGVLTYVVYCIYQRYHIMPRYIKAAMANKAVQPEIRLEIGLMASLFIPASMLIFGFTARANIHWIVPVIGASLYLPGLFLNFQSILIYVTSAYPAYAPSALAGNDLFRSVMASVFPLFGRAFFKNLGLGPGSALLAGISLLLLAVFWLLFKYGHVLRARSKYASRFEA
ncbi:major facilitator superfamily domain-containing protein [Mycena vulgaris]|nr:major facilitator superfamily domain-containing protein [Mycena vulgaris]